MIERLNQCHWHNSLNCPVVTILCCLKEMRMPLRKKMKQLASRFILEYRTLMNPTGVKAIMAEKENALRLTPRIFLLKLCKSLCIS